MQGFKRGILIVGAVGLLFSGGAAFTHASTGAVTTKAVTPKLTTQQRCAFVDAGEDTAIARGPQTGPAHAALLNAETLALHAAGCPAEPMLTTVTPSSVAVGSPIMDMATLAFGSNPTGQLGFTVFPTNNCTGAGTPVPPVVNVTGNGTYTSAPFVPTTAGNYSWAAFYTGDANNGSATSDCEPFTVTGSNNS